MVYHTEGMLLNSIQEVFAGPENDVIVCEDLASPIGARYTLWVVHDRACVRRLLSIFEGQPREAEEDQRPYLCRFAENDQMIFVFDYRPARRLDAFCEGQMVSAQVRENTCIGLIMECLASPMPFPLLCQMLAQGCVNIEKDNSIYFTYEIDLSHVREGDEESDCADGCVDLVLSILERESKLKSTLLLRKKLAKSAYTSLAELYRDVKLTAMPSGKRRITDRVRGIWRRNRDRLFRVLLVLSVIIVILTLIALLCQLIFGDIPLFRLFEHSMDVIGTETLKK